MKSIKFAVTTTALFIAAVLLPGCSSVPDYIGEDEKKLYDSLSDFQKDYSARTGLEAVKTVYLDTDKKVPMQFVLIPPSTSPEYKKYYGKETFVFGKYFWGEKNTDLKYPYEKNIEIENPFYLSTTPATRAQWKAVMGDDPDIVSFEKWMWRMLAFNKDSWEKFFMPALKERDVFLRKEPLLNKFYEAYHYYDWLDEEEKEKGFREAVKEKYSFITKFSEKEIEELRNLCQEFSSIRENVDSYFAYEKSACNNRPDREVMNAENAYMFKDDAYTCAKRLVFLRSDIGMQVPVETITYYDVQSSPKSFMKIFSFWTDTKASLPSVEEWEYVCAAGAETRFPWGDKLQDGFLHTWETNNPEEFSWSSNDPRNAEKKVWKASEEFKSFSQPVGLLNCNPWGLFDMVRGKGEYCVGENLAVAYPTETEYKYRKTKKDEICVKYGTRRGHNQLSKKERCSGTFRVKLSISDKELEAAKKKDEKK